MLAIFRFAPKNPSSESNVILDKIFTSKLRIAGGPSSAAAAPRKRQRRTGSSSPEEPVAGVGLEPVLTSLEPVLPMSAAGGCSSASTHNEGKIAEEFRI